MTSESTSAISAAAWADHIAAWRISKLTRAAYCRKHGLKVHAFLYRLNHQPGAAARPLTLVPVSTCVTPSAPSAPILHGPQGWSLSMPGDVSAAWLGQLLGALA